MKFTDWTLATSSSAAANAGSDSASGVGSCFVFAFLVEFTGESAGTGAARFARAFSFWALVWRGIINVLVMKRFPYELRRILPFLLFLICGCEALKLDTLFRL